MADALQIARRDLEDAERNVARLRDMVAKGEPVGDALATAEWWAEMVRKRVVRLSEQETTHAP